MGDVACSLQIGRQMLFESSTALDDAVPKSISSWNSKIKSAR